MHAFELSADKPIAFNLTGKFESPSDLWTHDHTPLVDYELIVMTKGSLYISHHHKNFEVKEGEILLLPPLPPPYNLRSGYRPSDCAFYWLHFSCEHPVSLLNISAYPCSPASQIQNRLLIPCHTQIPQPEKVIVLMKQLQDAVRLEHSSFAFDYMTTIILSEIHHQFLSQLRHPTNGFKVQTQIYNDIIDYVKQNIHSKLTVSHIAKHFGYNEKYLSHMFSSTSKMPLKQFILKNKMDEANFLLTDTNMSVREISDSLGFNDNHHFMKCYKKTTGLTPSEYRNAFAKRLLFHK